MNKIVDDSELSASPALHNTTITLQNRKIQRYTQGGLTIGEKDS
ncbi:hypothetical protein An12g03080 [Aspergillus niger]|uniref:Uncharacterized protein n=2 Tax=Aspergillus niger TaxID=5061 RepID=A2QYZ6_ASPNC|nr:hypothetical protein An12g03080 [Aspergillus niger]CAK41145.1 hypothetical protein An12g03080 [Aspergillus niger]